MKTFTDNTGRTWTLTVNVATIKRVRALCGVDLNSIVETDEKGQPRASLLERLSDDPVLLMDVLYAVCRERAIPDEAEVREKQIGKNTLPSGGNAGRLFRSGRLQYRLAAARQWQSSANWRV